MLRVKVTGTRSNKLRAKVEETGKPSYEVTIGGEKWGVLSKELQECILSRAERYVKILNAELALSVRHLNRAKR